MKKTLISAALVAATFTGAAAADVPETRKPIKFAVGDWTGIFLSTGIARAVLEDMGYRTDEVVSDASAWWPAMEGGDIDVSLEAWTTVWRVAIDEAEAAGQIEVLGEFGLQGIETWWYPKYVEELCPGLPDYTALKSCSEVFATAETGGRGRYLAGPVSWGGNEEERVAALGLDFEIVHAGTDAAMFAELDSAYARKEPIIMWLWAPHWAPVKYEGSFVEFPAYTPECVDDPSWGVNPDLAYDCDKPTGPVMKIASPAARDTWPCAIQTIENINMSNDEYGVLWGKVDLEGMEVEDVVDAWMAENQDRWKSWQACQG